MHQCLALQLDSSSGEMSLLTSGPEEEEGIVKLREREKGSRSTVVDSGTTIFISNTPKDFKSVEGGKGSIKLNVVGGSARARAGILLSNPAGFVHGAFVSCIAQTEDPFRLSPVIHKTIFEHHNSRVELVGSEGETQTFEIYKKGNRLPRADIGPNFKEELDVEEELCNAAVDQLGEEDDHFCFPVSSVSSDLKRHIRSGHMWTPKGGGFVCMECIQANLTKCSKSKFRSPVYFSSDPLRKLSTDFWGPVAPTSIRGFTGLQTFVCDAVAIAYGYLVASRSQALYNVKSLIFKLRQEYANGTQDKIVHRIRSDNDSVFTAKNYKLLLEELLVVDELVEPFCPHKNGTQERLFRDLGRAIRAMTLGCDTRLWCYAAEYFLWIRGNTRRALFPRSQKYNGLSPLEALSVWKQRGTTPIETGVKRKLECENKIVENLARRFGCLCFIKEQPVPKKMEPRAIPGVFLGVARDSTYIVGVMTPDKTYKEGFRWWTPRSTSVRFLEDILV